MSIFGFGSGGGRAEGEDQQQDGDGEDEKEDDFEILHHGVHKRDFDTNGCVFHLLSEFQNRPLEEGEKRGALPVAVSFHSGFEEDDEIRDEALIMGREMDVVQWALTPKQPNLGGGPNKFPIVRTPNRANMQIKLSFPNHAVKINMYTLRHGWHTSFYALREWVFEAKDMSSNEWFIVTTHKEDGSEEHPYTLKEKFGTCSYAVRGRFYAKEFRVRQIGKNSGGYDDLYICGIEVYGKLRDVAQERSLFDLKGAFKQLDILGLEDIVDNIKESHAAHHR